MSYNQEINVTSVYFQNGRSFPRQAHFNGRELNFLQDGLRCLVQKGQDLVQIFNMSDGQTLYRLSFEPGSRTWTLLNSRAL